MSVKAIDTAMNYRAIKAKAAKSPKAAMVFKGTKEILKIGHSIL